MLQKIGLAFACLILVFFIIPAAMAKASPSCGALNNTVAKTSEVYNHTTGAIMDNSYHDPKSLGAQSCLGDLLSIGTSIGLPSISVDGIIRAISNKACSAARQAKNDALRKINEALPTNEIGDISVDSSGRNRRYSKDKTRDVVDSVWGALN